METEKTYLFYDKANKRYLPHFAESVGAAISKQPKPVLIIENVNYFALYRMMENSSTPDGWIKDGPEIQEFLLMLTTVAMPFDLLLDLNKTLAGCGIHCKEVPEVAPAKPSKPGLMKRILSLFKK